MSDFTHRVMPGHSSAPGATDEEVVGGGGTAPPSQTLATPFSGALPDVVPGPLVSRAGAGPLAWFAAVVAVLLPLAASPVLGSVTFTPKLALLLVAGGVGTVPLLRLAWRRTPLTLAARLAVAFLAVALASALLSEAPLIGLFGLYLWGTGWLFWLGCAGMFAIGASLDARGRALAFNGLLLGVLLSAAYAPLQILLARHGIAPRGLGPYSPGQADSLLGNPIHLEALLAGGLALLVSRAATASWWYAGAAALLGFSAELTSERFFLAALVLLCAGALWRHRARGLRFAVPTVAGYALALASGLSSLPSRVTGGTQETTVGLRLHIWLTAAVAFLHRLLIGWGPGETEYGLNRYMTPAFARALGPGRAATDAHDVLVEVAVTTGLLGFAAFAGWLAAAGWRGSGPTLGFAAMVFFVEFVEPMNVAVTSLAFLALGVAAAEGAAVGEPAEGAAAGETARPGRPVSALRPGVVAGAALVFATALLGGIIVAGDAAYYAAVRPYRLSAARLASDLLFMWPQPAAEVAQIHQYLSVAEPGANRRQLILAARADLRAARRDPGEPVGWAAVGVLDLDVGATRAAEAAFVRAVGADPWSEAGLAGLAVVAVREHDWSRAVADYRLALRAVPEGSPLHAVLRRDEQSAARHLASAQG
jgi:hypothetical protein